jgi:NADH-quinone oxidoreductase subunit C
VTPVSPEEVSSVLGERAVEMTEAHGWTVCRVEADQWYGCLADLNRSLEMDYLACLTAVDRLDEERMELAAHLMSLKRGTRLAVKCFLPREGACVRSVRDIWAAADWLERETHEMFGIGFEGHPDLSNLLLPDGWEGHPLRKDYVEPD